MIYGLMYSGGVDSIVCLKLLRDQGITPYLIHFQYDSLKRYFKRVKKTAKILSPDSKIYVWDVDYYQACTWIDGNYHIKLSDKINFYPADYFDKLIIGYFEGDIPSYPIDRGKIGMKEGIQYLLKNPKIILPLRFMSKTEIERIWKTLPLEVRVNTLTSSRKSNGEWITI
jgi:hypothetical protein